jgi:hypothetical protein
MNLLTKFHSEKNKEPKELKKSNEPDEPEDGEIVENYWNNKQFKWDSKNAMYYPL